MKQGLGEFHLHTDNEAEGMLPRRTPYLLGTPADKVELIAICSRGEYHLLDYAKTGYANLVKRLLFPCSGAPSPDSQGGD